VVSDLQFRLNFYPDNSPFWDSSTGQETIGAARTLGLEAETTNRERHHLQLKAARLTAEMDAEGATPADVWAAITDMVAEELFDAAAEREELRATGRGPQDDSPALATPWWVTP
jgi:hypothetical protein